jgi:hypothetical protein
MSYSSCTLECLKHLSEFRTYGSPGRRAIARQPSTGTPVNVRIRELDLMNVEGLVLHVIIEDGPLHLEEANGS